MRITREHLAQLNNAPPSWLTKALIGALIATSITLLTALSRAAWDYKLDTNRFVIDSIKRSGTTDEQRHLDSLLHLILLNQQRRAP